MSIETQTTPHPKGELQLFTMTNAGGASVSVSNIGAGIVSVVVPDRAGKPLDVALGYKSQADYFADAPYIGKTAGRFANRIAKGCFTLNGSAYKLAVNNGANHLHGGLTGFSDRLWNGRIDGNNVVFSLVSADGDEGYPGTLHVEVAYTWSDANELSIAFRAESDDDTVINLTNHAYFNLAGENSGQALDHVLQLHASHWLPTDDTLIPTGEIAPVEGTPMDFTSPKPLRKDFDADFDALKFGKGYDNCWVVDGWKPGTIQEVAVLHSAASGITLRVLTTQRAVQVYTGNWLGGSPESKSGRSYRDYDGVALECQGFPDAPNKPAFPSPILRKGDTYRHTIVFRFS
ncbi:MAG: galactose mutarotase [Prevotellaceae bacterium]|jgi:aldose 1-epimerase|nr:galactose mutarotase [Prevotellaceae bacterium]